MFISVIASGFIAGFVSTSLNNYLDSDRFKVMLLIFIYEHSILFIRYIINAMFPSVPLTIQKRLVQAEIFEKKYTTRVRRTVSKKSNNSGKS